MPNSERNSNGTFKKGSSGNPNGRPRKQVPPDPPDTEQASENIDLVRAAISSRDWLVIFARARQDAISGDDSACRDRARRFLADYLLGRPDRASGRAGANTARPPAGLFEEYAGLSTQDLRSVLIELLAQEVARQDALDQAGAGVAADAAASAAEPAEPGLASSGLPDP